ncbi:hypothetical protein Ccrd_010348, partial [Cynara cardunculus var. scolymus]
VHPNIYFKCLHWILASFNEVEIPEYLTYYAGSYKSIHFSTSNLTSHAFDPDARDGHDLLIGLIRGDVYSVSIRLQLQDVGKKLVGAQHYNRDGCINNRQDQNFFKLLCTSNSLED